MKLIGAKSKKGSAVIDGITVIIIGVVMAIASMFALMIFDELNSDIQADPEFSEEAQAVSGDLYSKFPSLMDNLFLFAFILFMIFVLVSVFVLDTHPIFFVLSIILLIAVFVVGIHLANAYDDIAGDPSISPYANQLPYTGWILSHLVEVIIAFSFLVMIALFAKFKFIR